MSNDTLFDRTSRQAALLLLAICVPLIAGGAAWTARTSRIEAPTFLLGDVSESHLVEIRDARGSSVLSGEFRSRSDAVGNTEKDAGLFDRSGRRVIGEIEIEVPAPGRENRRPELEVDVIGLAPRQTFSIVIDDRIVGRFVTDDRGSVDMELQEGEVPPGSGP
jgi:hypothetical protein